MRDHLVPDLDSAWKKIKDELREEFLKQNKAELNRILALSPRTQDNNNN